MFPLETELESIAQHRGAYWLIVNRLLADLGLEKLKDNCGQKPERLWYGNTKSLSQLNLDALVPAFLLEDIEYEEATDFVATDCSDADLKRCQWLLREFLRPSEDGEYEDYYLPVMVPCKVQALFDDWVDGFFVVIMVKKKKTFNHLNGKVSANMQVILNCIRLLRSKIVTGLPSCLPTLGLVQSVELLAIQRLTLWSALTTLYLKQKENLWSLNQSHYQMHV